MKRTAVIFFAIVFSLVSSVYAIYTVTDTETWPKSWPAELEPLRKQSRTFEGPKQPLQHHAIPFTKRDEFESAWPHLLKIKSKGARSFCGGLRVSGWMTRPPQELAPTLRLRAKPQSATEKMRRATWKRPSTSS